MVTCIFILTILLTVFVLCKELKVADNADPDVMPPQNEASHQCLQGLMR